MKPTTRTLLGILALLLPVPAVVGGSALLMAGPEAAPRCCAAATGDAPDGLFARAASLHAGEWAGFPLRFATQATVTWRLATPRTTDPQGIALSEAARRSGSLAPARHD